MKERKHDALKLITAISLYDLGQKKPSSEELVAMIKQFNYEAAAAFLARFNLYLSLAYSSKKDDVIAGIHEKLTARVLSPERLQELANAFNGNLYQTAIVLNRSQLLVGIKLLALYAPRIGGNLLETETERYQIGELALAINSFYGPDLAEPHWPEGDVSAQFAASAELHNAEPILTGLVRTRCLIGLILDEYTTRLKGHPPPPFERIFTLLNGVNFRDFLDITLYLYLEQSGMLDELMATEKMTYVDVREPKRYLSGEKLRNWVEPMATSIDDLPSFIQGSEADLAFFFDVTVFRRFPFWRSGRYKYFCIDAMFLAEKLSSYGFYWTILNGLVDDHIRSQFQAVWGELVQEYVRELLEESFSGKPGGFLRRPTYDDDGSEVFDCAILLGDGLIPIEIKGSVLPIAEKYAAKAGAFYQGVSTKFGSGPGAAVEQLLRNIEYTFSADNPRSSSQIAATRIRRILPIAIVHDPILRFGSVARALATEFSKGLMKLKLRSPLQIYPFQILTVEELERLQPYIEEGFDMFECVLPKAKEDPGYRLSLWEFTATRFLPAKDIKPRPNEKMIGRFEWLTKAQSWRVYRGDYYDHALASRGTVSDRAIICARPIGGDRLLWDEVIAYREYSSPSAAYKVMRSVANSEFPKQPISAEWFECHVVNEFGIPIEEPT